MRILHKRASLLISFLLVGLLLGGVTGYSLDPSDTSDTSQDDAAIDQQFEFGDGGRQVSQQIAIGSSVYMPILVDGQGKVLGMAVNSPDAQSTPSNYDFFDRRLKRVVTVGTQGELSGLDVTAYYKTDNCTGTAFGIGATNLRLYRAWLPLPQRRAYYIVKDGDAWGERLRARSHAGINGCVKEPSMLVSNDFRTLTQVGISYSDPIPMPIHFR